MEQRTRWKTIHMAETSSTIYSPFYIYRKREVIWRQTWNGSCILRFLNHQPKLNYTSILSIELIAKTPKSVVTS